MAAEERSAASGLRFDSRFEPAPDFSLLEYLVELPDQPYELIGVSFVQHCFAKLDPSL
jgi:hypothetical protein